MAEPEIFKPERVVVPKPSDETESCVAVDEPTRNPTESPAIGLTERRANGEVEPIPTAPDFVTMNAVVDALVTASKILSVVLAHKVKSDDGLDVPIATRELRIPPAPSDSLYIVRIGLLSI